MMKDFVQQSESPPFLTAVPGVLLTVGKTKPRNLRRMQAPNAACVEWGPDHRYRFCGLK